MTRKQPPRLPASAFAELPPAQSTPSAPSALIDAHCTQDWDHPSNVVLIDSAHSSRPILTTAITVIYDGSEVTLPAHTRVVDVHIKGGIDHDHLAHVLATHIPIVLANVLPPPLDAFTSSGTLINHPTYTTYRHRIASLSLFENVYLKLLPPAWVPPEASDDKELINTIKLFLIPALEAFGFERILFGSGPATPSDSPVPPLVWYNLVLESLRELAVSQDELDHIFVRNAERVYG